MNTFSTSGSTAAPKKFTLTDEQIAARIARMASLRPPGWADLMSMYCDLHPTTTTSIRDRKWIETKGGNFFGPLDDRAKTIAQFAANGVEAIVASPVALVGYARDIKGAHKFKLILASGSPLMPDQSRTIRDGLGENLWHNYACSEVGTIALASAAQAEAIAGCVGKPCDGVQMQIINGELQVKTTTMITGYADKATTDKYFKDGWFLTGDKAELTKDGLLVLKGRV